MDFIKNAANQLNSGNNANANANTTTGTTTGQPGTAGQPAAGGQQQDYGDKAFAAGSKKAGYNIDANTQEKISDGARGLYEKATGSKVDAKYSN